MPTNATMPLDALSACRRYQEIRPRLVRASGAAGPRSPHTVPNLIALRDQIDVFVLDGFGVLNVGEEAIPGAAQAVSQLRESGAVVIVLTNGASMPAESVLEKYQKLGFDFELEDVISSRMALERHLKVAAQVRRWGFMALEQSRIDTLAKEALLLGDNRGDYDLAQGFVLLGSGQWSANHQHFLLSSLSQNPRPVLVANPDLVAPRADRFSLEPGYFAHQIADTTQIRPHFFGKPFQNVFDIVRERINALGKYRADRIAMVGDTLHTDILGGSAAGWRSVLVTSHGLMRDLDVAQICVDSAIHPDFIALTT